MLHEPPFSSPSYSVKFTYWYDHDTQEWKAELRYSEQRQGKQYEVIDHYTCPEGTTYKRFMLLVRQRVAFQLKTFWA